MLIDQGRPVGEDPEGGLFFWGGVDMEIPGGTSLLC